MQPPVTAPLTNAERNGHSGATPEECPLCAPLRHGTPEMTREPRERRIGAVGVADLHGAADHICDGGESAIHGARWYASAP